MRRLAVLGAGIQGTCAALELARRGCEVDLLDRERLPMSGASRWNEGKIHLGLIYAADDAARTANVLTLGSVHFAAALRRWGVEAVDAGLSEPFTYAIHRESMLDVGQIEAHFEAVGTRYRAIRDGIGRRYLDTGSDAVAERLPQGELEHAYDPAHVQAAYRTIERSVDPERLAGRLREAVAAEARITYLGEHEVGGVRAEADGNFRVASAVPGEAAQEGGSYAHVINALWGDRLRVDAGLGMRPQRPWLFRYKLALHVAPGRYPSAPLPTTTFMLGSFGDIVNFGGRRLYLSWYPVCRLASAHGLEPPDIGDGVLETTRRRVFDTTLSRLGELVPTVASADLRFEETAVEGGVIFNWGRSDISDPDSEVHQRWDIGVHSRDGYHSIDTGKYSMAPLFALEVADRIRPED